MDDSPLRSTDWLAERLDRSDIMPLDASWHMPDTGRSGLQEFSDSLIPGAAFFDIDEIADKSTPLPHTFPSTEHFQQAVRALGLNNDHTVIVYDKGDIPTAARAWWMFRAMGHQKVYMLDGGFKKWTAENRPITQRVEEKPVGSFTATPNTALLRRTADILDNLQHSKEQIVDARSEGRYSGTVPEPRAGLRSGHIPGSKNLPFNRLYTAEGTLKTKEELTQIVDAADIDLTTPIVTSCGSGVTACNLAIAFAALGQWDVAIYDGSWTEWGGNTALPIET